VYSAISYVYFSLKYSTETLHALCTVLFLYPYCVNTGSTDATGCVHVSILATFAHPKKLITGISRPNYI
jgi:hypothetical protein